MQNRRGTSIRFHPDADIFGPLHFSAARLYRLCRSKAYLFRGVRIRWTCDPAVLRSAEIPAEATLHFPGGLRDSLVEDLAEATLAVGELWAGEADLPADANGNVGGRVEWAVAWLESGDGALSSYCNTVPTPLGGTHEAGFRGALLRGLRSWGEQRGTGARRRLPRKIYSGHGGQVVRVRAGAAVPGTDQGEADQPGGDPPGRAGVA